jgi:hypothetical protein
MSKFAGKGAIINKPNSNGINTHGMPCVVECWDANAHKYKVDFGNGFVGWYKKSELKIEK